MRRIFSLRGLGLLLYFAFLAAPILWMLSMSFKTTTEILGSRAWLPSQPTLQNYIAIFTRDFWREAFATSLTYVAINTVICLLVALPAAYAFSRYRFRGDHHLFFWLLTNRMAPGAVFIMPFFQLYSNLGLFDTTWAVALAHTLFGIPLAVWILEGFMSGIPKEIDETAYVDGYSFGRFFFRIFMPLIGPGIGVTAFFTFMFSWVELLMSRTLTATVAKPISVTLTRSLGAEGWDWGVIAAAGVLTIIPGAILVYFVRNYLAKGFAMGRV